MLLLWGLVAAYMIFCIWYAYDWIKIMTEDSNNNQK
jgi:hypothetical protein